MIDRILLIDDEANIRELLSRILTLEGFNVDTADNGEKGLKLLEKGTYAVLITDVKLPDVNGVELVKKVKAKYPYIEIIVITAFGNIHDGVDAMKNGAFDYLVKGNDDDKLPLVLKRAYERAMLQVKVSHLEERINSRFSFGSIIGKSKKISEAIEYAKKVAPTDTTVLLLGETGTGKELFAQAIHNANKRKNMPFIAINCSAIPKDLQESELFGYKKGAFTGAVNDKKGFFEEAGGGTIFLDEVGDMSMETQAKLLRVIENKTYTRVGDPKERALDIRIIAATNKDLETLAENGGFRKDLFYRLNTFTIKLPSLSERADDLDIFIKHFIEHYSSKLNKMINTVSPKFVKELRKYPFRGNIRELKNIIERAVIIASNNELTADLLPVDVINSQPGASSKSLNEIEKGHILKILAENEGNKTQTAKALGIGTATLYRKLKEYGIEKTIL
ncbi:MAG: sigma-54-dependent transcriptional regulator [Ignavibacteria bacterium]